MSVSIDSIPLSRARTYASLAELTAVGKRTRTANAISDSTCVGDGEMMLAQPGVG